MNGSGVHLRRLGVICAFTCAASTCSARSFAPSRRDLGFHFCRLDVFWAFICAVLARDREGEGPDRAGGRTGAGYVGAEYGRLRGRERGVAPVACGSGRVGFRSRGFPGACGSPHTRADLLASEPSVFTD